MTETIQVIANFSEGRNKEIYNGLKQIAQNGQGYKLIGSLAEPDYNRSGFYLLGEKSGILDTVVEMLEYAISHIDMTKQEGPHPWIGAGDVIAVIPVKNITMEECVEYAEQLGQVIGETLKLPVYLYGEAAKNEERKDLSKIIKGEFEGFPHKIKQPEWQPDYGPNTVHPTAGVTAIGVRRDLISLNINLNTDDITAAKGIASAIREKNSGLKGLKAIALDLDSKAGIQISTTIENYKELPLHVVFERVKKEANNRSIEVINSEIFGIVPADVMIQTASHYLQADHFNSDKQILENYLI